MSVEFTIKPVQDAAEVYAVARIMGDLIKVMGVDVNESCDVEQTSQRLSAEASQNPRFSMFAAYRSDGGAVGYICGEIRPDIFSGQPCGYELLWVVADAYRKSGVGLALLDQWETFCKEKGCQRVYMGLNAHTQPEILRHIYSRRGYALKSESYSKTF